MAYTVLKCDALISDDRPPVSLSPPASFFSLPSSPQTLGSSTGYTSCKVSSPHFFVWLTCLFFGHSFWNPFPDPVASVFPYTLLQDTQYSPVIYLVASFSLNFIVDLQFLSFRKMTQLYVHIFSKLCLYFFVQRTNPRFKSVQAPGKKNLKKDIKLWLEKKPV